MTPFAIAGVQMHLSALQSNVDGMIHRLDLLMARFPWARMVLFSELAPFGPLPLVIPRQDVAGASRADLAAPNAHVAPNGNAEQTTDMSVGTLPGANGDIPLIPN